MMAFRRSSLPTCAPDVLRSEMTRTCDVSPNCGVQRRLDLLGRAVDAPPTLGVGPLLGCALMVYSVGDPNCWIVEPAKPARVDRRADDVRHWAAWLNSTCISVPPVNSML